MTWHVMDGFETYEHARDTFAWNLPDRYNPAVDFLRKHDSSGVALRYDTGDTHRTYTRHELDEHSDRLAAALDDLGITAGTRVAVVAGQRPETLVAHLANWKLGAVSVPLTTLFGPDALAYRLADSGAVAAIVSPSVYAAVDEARDSCPELADVLVLPDESGDTRPGREAREFDSLLEAYEPGIDIYDSTPETPTAIMYTSGSTGPPKGVLHTHALWLGRAAAAATYFEQPETATLWTPADWAWGGALGGTVFAAWHYGLPVVGCPREGFDPEWAFDVLAAHDVTHAFIPPTALRMMQGVQPPPELSLSVIASAGEPLTPDVVSWVDTALSDVSINEFYGQTELNLVVANCSRWFETRVGSMGKPLPGYELAIFDTETREPLEAGEIGEIALRPDDRRVFFSQYWNLPEKTEQKQVDGWFLTGDIARQDEEGYVWFVSRADDLIISRGYRVSPTETEAAILEHPAVAQVAVVGIPDETLGEAIKAFVEPAEAIEDAKATKTAIQERVRNRLAAYQYPDEIEFVEALPRTSTGKIRRESLRED